jgi:hypothetical protein
LITTLVFEKTPLFPQKIVIITSTLGIDFINWFRPYTEDKRKDQLRILYFMVLSNPWNVSMYSR